MNKRLRGIKRSVDRWCRHHGVSFDKVLGQFGLARAKRIHELEQIVQDYQDILDSLEKDYIIDEDALYQ